MDHGLRWPEASQRSTKNLKGIISRMLVSCSAGLVLLEVQGMSTTLKSLDLADVGTGVVVVATVEHRNFAGRTIHFF